MIVNVCIGSACHLKGSYEIINKLNQLITDNGLSEEIIVKASFCLGNCMNAVSVKCQDEVYSVSPETVEDFFQTVVREKV